MGRAGNSLQKLACFLESWTFVQLIRRYGRTRASEDLSRHRSQQRAMLSVLGEANLCPSPENRNQVHLQSFWAAKIMIMNAPQLSSRLYVFSWNGIWGYDPFQNLLHTEAVDVKVHAKVVSFNPFHVVNWKCTADFRHGIWCGNSCEKAFYDWRWGVGVKGSEGK